MIGTNNLTPPNDLGYDGCYACPTNKERNSVSAGIFKKITNANNPNKDSDDSPPTNTIIIESTFGVSTRKTGSARRINNTLRHRILTTCGDADIEYSGNKKADPSLCLYSGINLIFTGDNSKMNEKPPRGNGTVCKFISVKIKENATSHRIKMYNNRKVWAVSIEDVEWITVELMDNTDEIDTVAKKVNDLEQKLKETDSTTNINTTTTNIKRELEILQEELKVMHHSRQFNITPERRNVEATVQPSRICSIRDTFKLEMNLLPVNIATACTGHKLQGRSKDTIIITSWPQFKNNVVFQNWEYVVLSRVRTLNGLFLLKPHNKSLFSNAPSLGDS